MNSRMIKCNLIGVFKALLKFLYYFMKLLPSKKKVVMVTRQSNRIPLDFELLKHEIEEAGQEMQVIVLAKKIETGFLNKIAYCTYMLKIMYHLATSKVCVIDGYCIPVSILKHKKSLKVIQIWHASGAVKKFGYQVLDKQEGHSRWLAKAMCMHKNYDYVIAPSEATKKVFAEAFNIPEEKVVKLGLPRLEYITNAEYDKTRQMLEEYPKLKGKKNIVYIPTFRKNKGTDLTEILNYPLDRKKYNLIINLHPLDTTNAPEEYQIDKKYNSYDLIKLADYIITDYSILSVEGSILHKPIFLYTYDYEEYQETRGLNINLEEELGSFTSHSFNDIMRKIEEQEYNMTEIENFRNKYIEVNAEETVTELSNFITKVYKGE